MDLYKPMVASYPKMTIMVHITMYQVSFLYQKVHEKVMSPNYIFRKMKCTASTSNVNPSVLFRCCMILVTIVTDDSASELAHY